MGYRSDVAISVKKNDWNSAPSDVINNLTSWGEVDVMKDEVHIDISSIKWYMSYDEIKSICHWLNSLDVYHFLRVGEESGDIEESYKGSPDETFVRLPEATTEIRYYDC